MPFADGWTQRLLSEVCISHTELSQKKKDKPYDITYIQNLNTTNELINVTETD